MNDIFNENVPLKTETPADAKPVLANRCGILKQNVMKYYLLKNDTSKKISDMYLIDVYLNIKDVPKTDNTILIIK
jgi:hypothetical protein